ncbi:MAG: hypothetical protein CVU90_08855 [Firmicutes bacterium HGW-Firmicutes-15]|nr:MAG: hypothetical protein CVU90_08855 [Firmicutes bacterium HGW-Firmicutes-15]
MPNIDWSQLSVAAIVLLVPGYLRGKGIDLLRSKGQAKIDIHPIKMMRLKRLLKTTPRRQIILSHSYK